MTHDSRMARLCDHNVLQHHRPWSSGLASRRPMVQSQWKWHTLTVLCGEWCPVQEELDGLKSSTRATGSPSGAREALAARIARLWCDHSCGRYGISYE